MKVYVSLFVPWVLDIDGWSGKGGSQCNVPLGAFPSSSGTLTPTKFACWKLQVPLEVCMVQFGIVWEFFQTKQKKKNSLKNF